MHHSWNGFSGFRIAVSFFILIVVIIAGCQKEGDTPTTVVNTNTEDAVAYLVASFMGNAQSTNGLSSQLTYATEIAGDDSLWKKGLDSSFVLTHQKDTGSFQYYQLFHYHYTFDSDRPDSVEFDYTDSGSYNYGVMNGWINDNGSFTVAGIKGIGSYVIDNGIYTRIIQDTLKILDKRAMSGSLTFEFYQIIVSKTSHVILSGVLDVTASFDTPDGGSVDYTGTLTLAPNNKATFVVNGRSYLIDFDTATATYITP